MSFFIKAGAKEIFIVLMGIFALTYLTMRATSSLVAPGLGVVVGLIAMSLWLRSITVAADAHLRENLRSKSGRIDRVLVLSNLASALMFVGVLPNSSGAHSFLDEHPGLPIPLILLSVGGLIYCVCLASKQLVTFEKMREVSFAEYASTAILLWFWYVGVWILQPRVQRLAA